MYGYLYMLGSDNIWPTTMPWVCCTGRGAPSDADSSMSMVCQSSLSLRRYAHGLLAKRLMHMTHLSGNTSGVSKLSSDWLNYTGFQGDVCVTFFNVPPGIKNAVAPNPLVKEESFRAYNERLSGSTKC